MNTQDDFNVDAEERKKFTLEEAKETFGVKKEDKTIEFDTMKDSLSEEEIQQAEAQRAIDLALQNDDGTYGNKDAEAYNYGDYTADNTLQNLNEAGRMAVDVARYGLKAVDKLWGTGEEGTPLKRAIDYLDDSEQNMIDFHKFTLNRQNEYQEKFGIMGRAGLFATDVFQNMYLDPSDYVYGAIVGANKFTKLAGRLPFIRFAYNTYDIYDKLPHQYGENEFQQLGAMVAMQLGMKGAGKLVSKALAKNIEFDSESSSADKRSFTEWVKDNMHYSEDLTNNLVYEHSKINIDKYEKMQEKGMLEIDHTYLATVQYRADNGLPLGVYNNHVLKSVEENSTDKIFEIYYKKIADYQKETGNYDIPSFEDFKSFVDGITNLPAGYRVGAIKDAIASGALNEDVYAKAIENGYIEKLQPVKIDEESIKKVLDNIEINNLKVPKELEQDLKNVLDLYKNISYLRRLNKATEQIGAFINDYFSVKESGEELKDMSKQEIDDLLKDLGIDPFILNKYTDEDIQEIKKILDKINGEIANLEEQYPNGRYIDLVKLLKDDFNNSRPSDLKDFSKRMETFIDGFKDPEQREKFLKKYSEYAESFKKLAEYLEEDYKKVVEDPEYKEKYISNDKNSVDFNTFKDAIYKEGYYKYDKVIAHEIDEIFSKKYGMDLGDLYNQNKWFYEGVLKEYSYVLSKPELKKIFDTVKPMVTFASSENMHKFGIAGSTFSYTHSRKSYIMIADVAPFGTQLNFEADKPFSNYADMSIVHAIVHELGHAVQNFIDVDKKFLIQNFENIFEQKIIKPLQLEEEVSGIADFNKLRDPLEPTVDIDYLAKFGTYRMKSGFFEDDMFSAERRIFIKNLSESRFLTNFLSEYGIQELKAGSSEGIEALSKEFFAELFAKAYSPFTMVFDDETKNLLSDFRKIIDGELQKKAELDATTVDIDFSSDKVTIGKIVYPTAMKNVFADYEKEFDYLYEAKDITEGTKLDSPLDKIKADSEWMKNNHIDFASTSKGNSDRRLPKIYSELAEGRVPDIKPTDLILDFGAGEGWKGQYDLRKEAGIKNDVIPYDKYIEGINDWYKVEEEINKAKAEGRDIVIVSSNVLNVIPVKGIFGENLDKAYVEDTVKEIEDTANKYGAKVIVSVYEGDGAHKGTPQIMKKSYQSNMPLRFYTRFFEDKSKITIASSHIIYEPNKQPLYVPQDLSYGKVVGNNRYQYIGNNKVAVTDKKTGDLLFVSTVDDWNKPEPVVIKFEYPNGKVKIPTLKARQVYHSRHMFMNPDLKDTELYKESEARSKKIDAELERIGVSKKAIGYEQKWLEYLKQMNLEEKKIEEDDFQISYYKMLNTEQPKPVHISGDIQKDYEASIKNLVNLTQRLVRGDKGIDVKNTVINSLQPLRFHLYNAVKAEAYGMKQGLWGDTKMLQILDPSKFEEIQTLGAKIVIDALQTDSEIINPQFTKAMRTYWQDMVEYKSKEEGTSFEQAQYIMGIDTFYNKNEYQSQLKEFVKNPTPEMLEKMAGVLRPEHLESLKDENFRHTLYVDHTLTNFDKNNPTAMIDHATLADFYYKDRETYVSMYEGMEKDIKDIMVNILTGALKNKIHLNILNEVLGVSKAKHNNKDAFILASIDADTKKEIEKEIEFIQRIVNKAIRNSIAPSKISMGEREASGGLAKWQQNNGLGKITENILSWKYLSNLNYLAESTTNHREVYKSLRDMGFINNGEYVARALNGLEQYGNMGMDHLRFLTNFRNMKHYELNKIKDIHSRLLAKVFLEKKMENLTDYSDAWRLTRGANNLGKLGGAGQTFSDLERMALAEFKLFKIFSKGLQVKNEDGTFNKVKNLLNITDEQLELVRARLKGMDAEELYALLFEKSYSNDDVEHNIQRLWNNIISDVGKDFDSKARVEGVEDHFITRSLLLYKRYSIRMLNKIARENTTHTEADGVVKNSLETNYEHLTAQNFYNVVENTADVTANVGYALNRVIGKTAITLLTGLIFRSSAYYQVKAKIKGFLEGDYFNIVTQETFNSLIDNTGISIALGSTRGTTPLGQFVQAYPNRVKTGMRNGIPFGEASGYSAVALISPEVISRSIDFYNLKKDLPATLYDSSSEIATAWYKKYYRKIGEAEQQSSEGVVLPVLLFLPRATGMLFEMMKDDVGLSQEASGIMDAEVDSELVASIATQNIVNASELARTEAILTLEESELEKLGISYKDEYNLLSEDIKPKWNRAMEYLQLEEKKKLLLLTKLNDFETEEEKLKFLKEQIPPSKLEKLGLE